MINSKRTFCICDFETTGLTEKDYPIEIGCIFTDNYFRVLDTYSSYILPQGLKKEIDYIEHKDYAITENHEILKEWPEEYQDAYKVHKIPLQVIKEKGVSTITVVDNLLSLINNIKTKFKPTLISDNPYFEMLHMKKLFEMSKLNMENYFHYIPWGTSMLLKPLNINYITTKNHRAFDDASNLYLSIIRAMEKINYFNFIKE